MQNVRTPQMNEVAQGDVGAVAALISDTPWTTTVVQACERRSARAWLDSYDHPRNVAVMIPGSAVEGIPPTAYLFGGGGKPDVLVDFCTSLEGPLDVICDDDVGEALSTSAPGVALRDHSVHWFERLDSIGRPDTPGIRRLRLSDGDMIEALQIPGLLRAFESVKDVLMIGGGYGVFDEGNLLSAAFTVDLSVNYARILPFTLPEHRRRGLAVAVCRRLIASHHEQGRLTCFVADDRDPIGEKLAAAIGCEAAARLTSYHLA